MDDDRLTALENDLALLRGERAALHGAITLLVQLLSILERERLAQGEASIVEMMDSALVAHRLSGSVPAELAEAEQASNFAMSLLEAVHGMVPRPG
jgi:hypothetical protein